MYNSITSCPHTNLHVGSIGFHLARCLVVFLLVAMVPGCAEFSVRTKVIKDGKATWQETGIRYYLPKPYLLLSKSLDTPQHARGTSQGVGYAVEVIYLPDLVIGPQQVRLHPRLGSVSADLKLTDGWQLSGANVKLDSKFSEALTAAGTVAAAPAFAPTAGVAGKNIVDVLLKLIEQPGTADSAFEQLDEVSKPTMWLFEIKVTDDGNSIEFKPVWCFGFHADATCDKCNFSCGPGT